MSPYSVEKDYQTVAKATIPSFHFRTGKVPLLPKEVAPKEPANQFGFPQPGQQSPSPAYATARNYFVDETTWNAILDHGQFDDIVVGSGFCALAYIDAALKLNPHRKILVLERGDFWLPSHFQNLPLPFKMLLGGVSETFPWKLSSNTYNSDIQFMRGSCPFFGGRSTFWSAWCPRPSENLMRNFPRSLLETAAKEEFWDEANKLLHVHPATDLHNNEYQILQKHIDELLKKDVKSRGDEKVIKTADYTEAARLAVGRTTALSTLVFEKFSTPGPLLAIYERQRQLAKTEAGAPLMIATDVVVQKFEVDPEDPLHRANVLHTSRGTLCFPRSQTNIILATGAIPACTIVMNSIGQEQQNRAGTRLSGHFLSHIAARFPIPASMRQKTPEIMEHLEIAASYLAGKDPSNGLQYHVQITAIHSPHPETDAVDAARLCPDYAAAASEAQLKGSEDYIVVVCATLGELDEKNPQSHIRHDLSNPDVTTNIRLQVMLSDKDKSLRKVMNGATYETIKVMAAEVENQLEYWHDSADGQGTWKTEKPSDAQIRIPGIVHETSTLYMSDNVDDDMSSASVDSNYRPKGCHNVYVTGGAIFPTAGSWNPTLTMCGFAQDLAKKLHEKGPEIENKRQ